MWKNTAKLCLSYLSLNIILIEQKILYSYGGGTCASNGYCGLPKDGHHCLQKINKINHLLFFFNPVVYNSIWLPLEELKHAIGNQGGSIWKLKEEKTLTINSKQGIMLGYYLSTMRPTCSMVPIELGMLGKLNCKLWLCPHQCQISPWFNRVE